MVLACELIVVLIRMQGILYGGGAANYGNFEGQVPALHSLFGSKSSPVNHDAHACNDSQLYLTWIPAARS